MSYDDDLAATDRAVAGYFDTVRFTAIAMKKPERSANAAEIPDTCRASFDFLGSIETAPEFSAFGTSNAPRPSDRSIRQVAKICLTALTSDWPWLPRQGDRIRQGDVLYQVAAKPDSDGTTRLAFWLNKIQSVEEMR